MNQMVHTGPFRVFSGGGRGKNLGQSAEEAFSEEILPVLELQD